MGFSWSPIDDLPSNWAGFVNPQVTGLVAAWHEEAGHLRQDDIYKDFLIKLRRQWAIETGAIERLYTLSEGATKSLIEKGLDAALLTHLDTDDQSPEQVVELIKDQQNAIEGLYQFVSDARPLTKSYLREIHQAITKHQTTYDAHDTLGNAVKRALPRGEWKRLPNNVTLDDGSTFEFCPPEHVENEMERLISMYEAHAAAGVPPEVEAAWLHHRFTLIHPFVDGNGRVARCLATLILLRANWLPLVVTRADKPKYIASIRTADAGDLGPLVGFFGDLQRRAVRQALSLSEEVSRETKAIRSILQTVRNKFAKRHQDLAERYKRAIATSDALHELVRQRIDEVAKEVTQTINPENKSYKAFRSSATRGDPRSTYHQWQIIHCAQAMDNYFVNVNSYRAWVALCIETEDRTEILFSLHGIGHAWSGVVVCTAMIYRRELTEEGNRQIGTVVPLSEEPFEITYADEPLEVEQRFRAWIEDRIITGLDHWQRGI